MRPITLIHTADWHLGQSFYGYPREYEQKAFLDFLINELEKKRPDLLIIAGDIFDTPNPSAQSQALFYNFLRRTSHVAPESCIVVTSGNHDSGLRLEAPMPLLEESNVYVVGTLSSPHATITVRRDGYPIAYVLALPFIRPGEYPSQVENYSDGIGFHVERLLNELPDKSLPIIGVAHLYTQGALLSEDDPSERVMIGGLQTVNATVFPEELSYVALGHIHKAQSLDSKERIRYSGSPLAMTFAESMHPHGILSVLLDDNGVKTEPIPFHNPVSLLRIDAKSEAELNDRLDELPQGTPDDKTPFLEVRLKMPNVSPLLAEEIKNRLRDKNVRLAGLRLTSTPRVPANPMNTIEQESPQEQLTKDPIEVMKRIYSDKTDEEMTGEMALLLEAILLEIQNPSEA